jgi:hypothetical protein
MSVPITCPHCGTTTDVADQDADQLGQCPECGNFIVAPPSDAQKSARSKRTWFSILTSCISISLKCFWVLLFGGIMAMMFLPMSRPHIEAARRIQCSRNLQRLALAIHNYATVNKCFPPAYVTDRNGKPLYSWRALVLPFIADETLAKRFHYDEPWDSKANRKLCKDGRKWFQCPTAKHADDDCTTDYVMVVGPHMLSDGLHSKNFGDITDGVPNTIMLVEVADSDINWAEPKDLEFDKMDFTINGQKPCVGSHHTSGANVALCDASVHYFCDTLAPETLKAALTIDGGEKVNLDD